jgi:two-component system, NtrC family, response regulator GlrR
MPPTHHVLLVDDDSAIRAVLVRLVARTYADATIAEATTGAEALSAVAVQRPDLIISDCHMPVMDGLELVRTLRGHGATMPILMLSSEPSIAKPAQLAGATAFLTKPLAIRSFSQFLHTLLPEDTETRVLGQ